MPEVNRADPTPLAPSRARPAQLPKPSGALDNRRSTGIGDDGRLHGPAVGFWQQLSYSALVGCRGEDSHDKCAALPHSLQVGLRHLRIGTPAWYESGRNARADEWLDGSSSARTWLLESGDPPTFGRLQDRLQPKRRIRLISTTTRNDHLTDHDRWRGISRRAADAALAYGGRDKTLSDVVALLEAGAYPNERDWFGWTPLHHAAGLQLASEVSEIPDIITALVEAGADPNARLDGSGAGTPLHVATLMSEIPEITRALLEAGSDPNAREDDGRTPLHNATRSAGKTAGVVSTLLAAGADPNARNESGETPLYTAVLVSEVTDVVTALLAAGADPNARSKRGKPLLHIALTRPAETAGIFAALLDGGADPNAGDENGWTPLHGALALGSQPGIVASTPGTIKTLLDAGADPNVRDYRTGGTTLHVAAAMSESPDIIEALLDAGGDPNARNDVGRKPFEVVPDASGLRGTASYRRLMEPRAERP